MAFPSSPVNGQQAVVNNITYQYVAARHSWVRVLSGQNTFTVNNLVANGNVSAAAFYWANGAPFASSSYGNTDVGNYLQHYTGNITAGGYFWANGTPFASSSYGNTDVSAYLLTNTGNIAAGNITTTGNIVGGGVRSTTSATAPANPTPGDIWYSTTDQTTLRYTYDGANRFWLDIGGPSLSTNIASLDTVIGQSVPIVSLNANVTAANAAIVTANSAVVSYVNTLNTAMIANTAAANAAVITANTGLKNYVDTLNTAMIANTAAANAAIVTANSAVVSYVNTLNTAMAANVAAANAAVITANTGLKSYVDTQDSLKAPLASPTFTGTITAPILSVTGNATIGGNILQQQAYYETYGNITNTGGNLTCNFNNGAIFYVTSITANSTASFTNVNALVGSVTATTLIIDQGATAYRISNIQINGVNQTIKWVSATPHTGTASNTDIVSFSLIHLGGGVYRVLGQSSSYG